jgi:hypothetical protein
LGGHDTPFPDNPDGHNLPTIRQSREPEPSVINEKTIADFTRMVEQTGTLKRERLADTARTSEE